MGGFGGSKGKGKWYNYILIWKMKEIMKTTECQKKLGSKQPLKILSYLCSFEFPELRIFVFLSILYVGYLVPFRSLFSVSILCGVCMLVANSLKQGEWGLLTRWQEVGYQTLQCSKTNDRQAVKSISLKLHPVISECLTFSHSPFWKHLEMVIAQSKRKYCQWENSGNIFIHRHHLLSKYTGSDL